MLAHLHRLVVAGHVVLELLRDATRIEGMPHSMSRFAVTPMLI